MEKISISVEYAGEQLSVQTRQCITSDDLILFVHGLGCSKASFVKVFDVPELHSFSLCTYDLVGFGESDKPQDFTYELQAQADILIEISKRFPSKRLHLVTHSMGGAVGLLAASRLLQLRSFLNVEGNLLSEDAGLVSRQVSEQSEQNFIKTGFHEFVRILEQSDELALLAWAKWIQQSDPIAFYRSACSLVKWSDSGELLRLFQSIRCKAYVHGELTDCSHLENHLQKIRRYMIPNGGHFMMIENYRDFYKSIGDWLKYIHT